MAELRLCFGMRVNDIADKICHRCRYGRAKHATHASSPSADFPAVDIKSDGLCGTGNPADSVAGAVHRTTVSGDVWRNPYGLNGEAPLYKAVRTGGERLGQCRSGTPLPHRCRTLQWAFVRPHSGDAGRSVPLYKTKTGYYEILGVPVTATHAQVKTAYYKQSFLYHPDRNACSDEATVRFSDISEAYTVLGNTALRRKYDRGLLSLSDLSAAPRPSSAKDPGRESRSGPSSTADTRGRERAMFDFDKFIKAHYNEQLQRERDNRVRKERLKQEEERRKDRSTALDKAVGLGSMFVLAVWIFVWGVRG